MNNALAHQHSKTAAPEECPPFVDFQRPNYFYGQMLGKREFQGEQFYHREKLKLHNRCLHGWGVVCGLTVQPVPPPDECPPAPDPERDRLRAQLEKLEQALEAATKAGKQDVIQELKAKIEEIRRKLEQAAQEYGTEPEPAASAIVIDCGLALDCEGNELVVRQPVTVDLWSAVDPHERKGWGKEKKRIYIYLCYCEQSIHPVRPVVQQLCGPAAGCHYGWTRESVYVKVTANEPPKDKRCGTCCDACDGECVLLAVINDWDRSKPVHANQVQNWVRRMVSTYPLTRITGISWTHGAAYNEPEVETILGTHDPATGLVVDLSRPIHTSTLQPGVFDLWIVEGGEGRSANIYHMKGDYVFPNPVPALTSRIRFRQTSRESLEEADRVLITIRTPFLLDECCRAVDGAHIGGRVPILDEFKENYRDLGLKGCLSPPERPGPWTSGNGAAGSTFESWFFIKQEKSK